MTQHTIMAVHAHPDDESIGTGGALARYSEQGVRTVLVTCTSGEHGEIADPAMAHPGNLGEVRRRELARACEILGISSLHLLGYRDSGMEGTPENNHPESFHRADQDEATGRLVALIRQERPDVLVTYDEQGFYGHPDHVQANRITVAAWHAAGDAAQYPDRGDPWAPKKLYYSTMGHSSLRQFSNRLREAGVDPPFTDETPPWGVPDEAITAILEVQAWARQKHAALMAHQTQMGANVFFAQMPPALFHEMFGREAFLRVHSRVPTPDFEDDLLTGL